MEGKFQCHIYHIKSRVHAVSMTYHLVDVALDHLAQVVSVRCLHHNIPHSPAPFHPVLWKKSLYIIHPQRTGVVLYLPPEVELLRNLFGILLHGRLVSFS